MAKLDSRLTEWLAAQGAHHKAPPRPPSGEIDLSLFASTRKFCSAWGEFIVEELKTLPEFLESKPVLLGSWARGELMPKSDLDIGFCGPEAAVRPVVGQLQAKGWKIRARVFDIESAKAWPEVEQLSLLQAKPLFMDAFDFAQKVIGAKASERKKFVRAVFKERVSRREKTSSFENVLEPNLKIGLGGLRDILQAEQVSLLFPELWPKEHGRDVLEYYRWFFNTIRLRLHLLGAGDHMQAALQPDIAKWFGYNDFKELMREVQKGLSRSLFYSDWMAETALASPKSRSLIGAKSWKSAEAMIGDLKKDPSILMQYQIRQKMDVLITDAWRKKAGETIFRTFDHAFVGGTEEFLRALFRSRLLDLMDQRLRPLIGYNQHDQYHAYTADTHILNLLIECKRAFRSPRRLGQFATLIRKCSKADKQMLAWACYYHDLGKGHGHDHESIGAEFVRNDEKRFRRSKTWTTEIAWLAQHHLEFSKAAFRENPRDENTLKRLTHLGLTPERIRRLAIFTVLDIRATHPKAWTPWKEKLLWDLVENLSRPKKIEHLEFVEGMEKSFGFGPVRISLLELVGLERIKRDFRILKRRHKEPSFQVHKVRGGFWVRYFNPEDKPGLLLSALRILFAAGCSVREAAIESIPGLGVYDWFMIESGMSLESLEKRLKHIQVTAPLTAPPVKWKSVEWMSVNDEAWTLLFRGLDQRGLLMATAERLHGMGAQIRSARVQTWGEQVEDIIEIAPVRGQDAGEWLKIFTLQIQG